MSGKKGRKREGEIIKRNGREGRKCRKRGRKRMVIEEWGEKL